MTKEVTLCTECRWLAFKDFAAVCSHTRGLAGTLSARDYCSHGEPDEPSKRAEKALRDARLKDAGFEL